MLPNYFDKKILFKKIAIELVSYLRFLLSIFFSRNLEKAWGMINKKENANKDIVLIAGGPSFNQEMQEYLIRNRSKYKIMVINYYYLNANSEKLVPDYYVLSDPQSSLKKNSSDINIEKFNYIERHQIKLICPNNEVWNFVDNIYLRFDDRESLLSGNRKPYRPRGYTSNTFFKAIAIALEMNFNRVFLVGFDYNYPNKIFLNHENKLFLKEEHHYGNKFVDQSIYFESVAHFLNWHSLDYHFLEVLKSDNVINVSDGSLIDCFKRMSVKDFLG